MLNSKIKIIITQVNPSILELWPMSYNLVKKIKTNYEVKFSINLELKDEILKKYKKQLESIRTNQSNSSH